MASNTPPALDAREVLRIARLARLELEPDAVESLRRDLASILEFVAALDGLDEPAPAAGAERATILREDEPSSALPAGAALANAPDPAADHFRVPRSFKE